MDRFNIDGLAAFDESNSNWDDTKHEGRGRMKTIIALLDFSDVAEAVVSTAGEAAKAFGGALYLIHVAAPDPDFVGYDVGPKTIRDTRAGVLRKEHRQLQEIEQRLKGQGVDARALLVQGPTVEKILEETGRLEAGLVVVGSHGHGALRNLLVGSVTEGVLRGAKCPVLVVPSRAG
jgi:nucleotide-binding universal stress UspA family protein